ncbi:hypothetical protein [Streptacidiphilus monticola]|uniref:Uncharacterized protein n=1 Tax=Streptacidiphilus monticola TaxID=2161674 RepID=A0ABW1G9J6_9ACTN
MSYPSQYPPPQPQLPPQGPVPPYGQPARAARSGAQIFLAVLAVVTAVLQFAVLVANLVEVGFAFLGSVVWSGSTWPHSWFSFAPSDLVFCLILVAAAVGAFLGKSWPGPVAAAVAAVQAVSIIFGFTRELGAPGYQTHYYEGGWNVTGNVLAGLVLVLSLALVVLGLLARPRSGPAGPRPAAPVPPGAMPQPHAYPQPGAASPYAYPSQPQGGPAPQPGAVPPSGPVPPQGAVPPGAVPPQPTTPPAQPQQQPPYGYPPAG